MTATRSSVDGMTADSQKSARCSLDIDQLEGFSPAGLKVRYAGYRNLDRNEPQWARLQSTWWWRAAVASQARGPTAHTPPPPHCTGACG